MSRALVEQAQRGDRDAYERLARAAAPRLSLVARRLLHDRDAADDAVQQTLVTMWRDLPSLRDPERFDAWTYRILVRACGAESRRERRRGIAMVDLTETMATLNDGSSTISLRDELDRAFERLNRDQRNVIVLHHLVGLPLGEIADVLGIPYGTVGSRLHHAMQALRAAIDAGERTAAARRQLA
jgi:RNA polymerase sigma-70 factor, ECF subfamily